MDWEQGVTYAMNITGKDDVDFLNRMINFCDSIHEDKGDLIFYQRGFVACHYRNYRTIQTVRCLSIFFSDKQRSIELNNSTREEIFAYVYL